MPDWQTEALPVLRAAYRQTEQGGFDVTSATIAQELERPPEDQRTLRTLLSLKDFGCVSGYVRTSQVSLEKEMTDIVMEPEGLKYVAGWPGSPEAAAANFLAVLQEAIDNASPEERGKLERLRDSAMTVGQSTLAGVLAKIITSA